MPECLKRHEEIVAEIRKSKVFGGLAELIKPLALKEANGRGRSRGSVMD